MFTVFELLTLYSVNLWHFYIFRSKTWAAHFVLSLLFFCLCLRCNFVNFRGWHLQISVCLYLSICSVFSSLTSSETFTFNHPTVLFVLLRAGWSISIEAKTSFSRLYKTSRLSKKQNKKRERERNSSILQTGWWRHTVTPCISTLIKHAVSTNQGARYIETLL